MTIPLAILISSFFASALTCFYFLFVRRSHDSEYITLSAKYADAASLLTSMRAKVDDLQEKLDFSEDVRYGLGMDNARMAKKIEELENEAEKGRELRLKLIEMLCDSQHAKGAAEHRFEIAQRSLRIARHKEFKRWKKRVRAKAAHDPATFRCTPSPTYEFSMNEYVRAYCHDHRLKPLLRESINRIKSMEPYPLP